MTQVIAISVTVDSMVLQGDTLHANAKALTAAGDSVATPIRWASFDTTILGVVDSTAGTFVGRLAGRTSIQARAGTLPSNPVPVRVVPPAAP